MNWHVPELPRPGELINDRFRIEQVIGRGTFGILYRVEDQAWIRPAALKLLLPHVLLEEPANRERFMREVRILGELNHPHTVKFYEFGLFEQGLPFYVMELLEGRTLDAELRASGPLPAWRVQGIAVQLLGALREAHAHGIIHRDLKPANVFLCASEDGQDCVKLLDFGIAKPIPQQLSPEERLTMSGIVLGTPAYMAPEQWLGRPLGPPTDLYALGVTLAVALNGGPVFPPELPIPELVKLHLATAPLPLPVRCVAGPLGQVVLKATEKLLARRYATTDEMLADLEALDRGAFLTLPGQPPPPGANRPSGEFFSPPGSTGMQPLSPEPDLALAGNSLPAVAAVRTLPELGAVLDGRYRLDEELPGSRRFLLYRATQLNMERPVWVKVLRPALGNFGEMVQRLRREVKVASALRHPGIVFITDFGETDGGLPYLVMEYLLGEPLSALLALQGRFSEEEVLDIGIQLLAALAEAHAHGIVHRNLKPANVFLCSSAGRRPWVKLIEFSFAKLLNEVGQDGRSLTRPGQALGTPWYMAPEQLRGETAGPTADLYALGLVLAEARTGVDVIPSGLSVYQVTELQLAPEQLPLSDAALAGPLGAVIRRALAKDPGLRYQSAEEMLAALEAVQDLARTQPSLPVPPPLPRSGDH